MPVLQQLNEWASVDPPAVDANPWNHVTVVTRGVTLAAGKFVQTKLSNITTSLKSQLGLATMTKPLSLRFIKTSVWGFPMFGKESPVATNLGVAFYQLMAPGYGTHDVRKFAEDVGTPVRPAHCSYKYKGDERRVVFESTQDHIIVAVEAQDSGLPLLYHFDLLWRSAVSDPVPSARSGLRIAPPPQGWTLLCPSPQPGPSN